MKLREELQKIIDSDTTYNKCATKYLYTNNPKVWQQVLECTQFLPSTALPKQRVWHILNNIFYIPLCPVTGLELAWKEKEYKKYATIAAGRSDVGNKIREFLAKNGHWRQDKEKSKKSKEKVAIGIKNGTITPYKDRIPKITREEITKKIKQTCLEKYGVENPAQTKESRQKIFEAHLKRGATPKHLQSARKLYYDAVWQFTEQSWHKHFNKINPNRINRSKNALDHIYSIQQGFRNNIPPYVIGHWTNLRIISLSENSKKGMRCDKTKKQLLKDFFKTK